MVNSQAIRVENLSKEFIKNKKTIDCVNLSIDKGELFCLVGANGAGKTTLIKILCGLILPTSGNVFINGFDVTRDSERSRASIGLVTGDERSFYWRLTGRQNIEFFATLYNLSPTEASKKIVELFDLLDIEEPDKRFQEYPTGIKQKLSIARALLNNPDILFIDELTKSLDPSSAKDLRRFIKKTLVGKHKKTVFFSTHHLHEIEELADRATFITKGRLTAVGTLNELREKTGNHDASIEEVYEYFVCRKDQHGVF